MKIGIIGAGSIGGTLARKLAARGHTVKISNSRGPETIKKEVLATGAEAVTQEGAVRGAEVIIVAVPLSAYASLAQILAQAPDNAVVVDTGNYYPAFSGTIEQLEQGEVQALWAAKELGRPVVKAWNAVLSDVLAQDNPATALPVAGDSQEAKELVGTLIRDTGFTPVDGGLAGEAWRQQPGSPAYCTNLGADELKYALALAKKELLATRRNLVMSVLADRAQENPEAVTVEYITALNRLVTAGSVA